MEDEIFKVLDKFSNEIVFKCKECGHLVYIDCKIDKVKKLLNFNCPECNTESKENWILLKLGDYEQDKGLYFD